MGGATVGRVSAMIRHFHLVSACHSFWLLRADRCTRPPDPGSLFEAAESDRGQRRCSDHERTLGVRSMEVSSLGDESALATRAAAPELPELPEVEPSEWAATWATALAKFKLDASTKQYLSRVASPFMLPRDTTLVKGTKSCDRGPRVPLAFELPRSYSKRCSVLEDLPKFPSAAEPRVTSTLPANTSKRAVCPSSQAWPCRVDAVAPRWRTVGGTIKVEAKAEPALACKPDGSVLPGESTSSVSRAR
mmetsp:Transcript_13820/g.32789  ORF Transcript_13820/g.32789 Transcript_13820/m.32789 type:complete len:248 (+) Transcript_13820:343-1086(+)